MPFASPDRHGAEGGYYRRVQLRKRRRNPACLRPKNAPWACGAWGDTDHGPVVVNEHTAGRVTCAGSPSLFPLPRRGLVAVGRGDDTGHEGLP